MDTPACRSAPLRPMRVLTHIARLSDCFGLFDVRISCHCGARREIDARELAARVGWLSLAEVQQRMRCSKCGKKGAAEVVARVSVIVEAFSAVTRIEPSSPMLTKEPDRARGLLERLLGVVKLVRQKNKLFAEISTSPGRLLELAV
jgi:hypothetical protein